MKKHIITNTEQLSTDDITTIIIFQCVNCGKQERDEGDLNICDNCNNYVCEKCTIKKEHQGYDEIFCSKNCRNS